MKKIIVALMFLVSGVFAQSNNVSINLKTYDATNAITYTYTLDKDIDTITIAPHSQVQYSFHRLQVKSTGTDTLKIMVLGENGSDYAGRATIEASTGNTFTFTAGTPVSTTSNEFILFDSYQKTIRIISTSNDASTTTFTLKYQK